MTDKIENFQLNSGREEVIFDGEDIRLVYKLRPSDTIILTFTVRPGEGKQLAGFATSLVEKYNFSAIYIIAKKPHWWQTEELAKVESIIQSSNVIKNFPFNLCYGASMGAHGVLLTAGRLGFSSALLIAPQVSVSPALVPFEDRWLGDVADIRFTEPDGRVGLRSSCNYVVAFDPLDRLDGLHASMLPRENNIQFLLMPFGGHTLPEYLKQTKVLSDLVIDVAHRKLNKKAIRNRVRKERIASGHYFDMMSKLLMKKKRDLCALNAAKHWYNLEPNRLPPFNRLCTLFRTMNNMSSLHELSIDFTHNNPQFIEGWRNLRMAAYNLKFFDDAYNASVAAMKFPGRNADDCRWLIRCMLRRGMKEQAGLISLEYANIFYNDKGFVKIGMEALEGAGRLKEALEFAKILAVHRNSDENEQNQANILVKKYSDMIA